MDKNLNSFETVSRVEVMLRLKGLSGVSDQERISGEQG